jgi:hypothetical protein
LVAEGDSWQDRAAVGRIRRQSVGQGGSWHVRGTCPPSDASSTLFTHPETPPAQDEYGPAIDVAAPNDVDEVPEGGQVPYTRTPCPPAVGGSV